jgi:cytochrome c553
MNNKSGVTGMKNIMSGSRKKFLILICGALAALANPALSSTFEEDLKRVDEALKTNPSGALRQSLESCLNQRNSAVQLYRAGMRTQAQRSLRYCFDSLRIPETAAVAKVTAATQEDLLAKSNKEYEKALALKPNAENGLAIYRECAACHKPEGWGATTGSVPQIAGQHRNVIVKQLADFRAGNRDSSLMIPYASAESIGGAQAVADVAYYISTLEMSVDNGKGSGSDLELGKRVYQEQCESCHGDSGQGDNDALVPRLQAQHYKYLLRQFQWIRDGKRRNAKAGMVDQIHGFDEREMKAVLDYSSRLMPAEEFRAPAGWKNPDFN